MIRGDWRRVLGAFALVLGLACGVAHAQSHTQSLNAPGPNPNRAPGFDKRPAASKLVVVPADMELFSISAGGVPEPRADWTQSAQQHFRGALQSRRTLLGKELQELSERDMDDFAQLNALHGAVAESVFLHHMWAGAMKLPTKNGVLDWSMGDAVAALRDKTGADYALFFWIRDSYASSERKAAMIALALVGVGVGGGAQVGYASLVDLKDGRVVWFNNVLRGFGDLREAKPAEETLDALLKGFPALQ